MLSLRTALSALLSLTLALGASAAIKPDLATKARAAAEFGLTRIESAIQTGFETVTTVAARARADSQSSASATFGSDTSADNNAGAASSSASVGTRADAEAGSAFDSWLRLGVGFGLQAESSAEAGAQ